jgi:hypothetical protein
MIMKPKPHLEAVHARRTIREALNKHWQANFRKGDLWITEYTTTYQRRAAYTLRIMEFSNGKVVHETRYFAKPCGAPVGGAQSHPF